MQMLRDLGEVKAELSAVKAELAGLRERIDDVVISNLRDHGKRMSMLETRVAALEAAENRRAGGMAAQRYDWETIRAEYEAGSSMGKLSDKYGVDKAAISRRAKKEAWAQDVTGAVDRAVDAKVNGIVNTVDPEKKAAAIASAADEKVAVIIRHREEWETQRTLVTTAIEKNDFDKAKLAKITAETLKIRQEAERKAWGIRDVDAQPDGGVLTVRILRVSGE